MRRNYHDPVGVKIPDLYQFSVWNILYLRNKDLFAVFVGNDIFSMEIFPEFDQFE